MTPMTKNEMEMISKLVDIGFKSQATVSKKWKVAFFYFNGEKTLFVLMRRHGVDLLETSLTRAEMTAQDGRLSVRIRQNVDRLGEYFYADSPISIHRKILEVVSLFVEKREIDSNVFQKIGIGKTEWIERYGEKRNCQNAGNAISASSEKEMCGHAHSDNEQTCVSAHKNEAQSLLPEKLQSREVGTKVRVEFELILFDLDDSLLATVDLKDLRDRYVGVRTLAYRKTLLDAATKEERILIPEETIRSICKKHHGVRIGVFTTAPRFYAESLLSHYYANTTWDVIVGFEDVSDTKPDPDGVLLACNKTQIKDLNRVVLIGDSWKDIASAYRAGCWAILFTRGWPGKMSKAERYRALNYLPDAIAENPNDIELILADPAKYLPLLEQHVFYDGYPPKDAVWRTPAVNHFDPLVEQPPHPYVRVFTLGRMFPNYKEVATRLEWHEVTKQIHIHKDALEFPTTWLSAVRSVIANKVSFNKTEIIVTVVPYKPGRTPRLERFLAQLAQHDSNNPISTKIKIEFMPDVLSYRNTARSHHGEYLKAQQRFENVRDNLHVSKPDVVMGKELIVIDDVVTTGATMYYANKYLESAGATKVTCLALTQNVKP